MKRQNAHYWPNPALSFYNEPDLKQGIAGQLLAPDSTPGQWSATIYLPDPTERRGWRQYFVYRQEPPQATKPMGFR